MLKMAFIFGLGQPQLPVIAAVNEHMSQNAQIPLNINLTIYGNESGQVTPNEKGISASIVCTHVAAKRRQCFEEKPLDHYEYISERP